MSLIQGTNAGEQIVMSSKQSTGSFFKNDIETLIITAPKEGHSLDVIILPSFDSMKGPSEFRQSYSPYREVNSDLKDPITKTPAFTGWAKSCKAYSFFGNQRKNFVSPLTGKAYRAVKSKKDNKVRYYPPSNIDPVVDIANYIFFNYDKLGNDVRNLITKNEKGIQPLPRGPKSYILSNALVSIDNGKWQFKIIAYSETAYIDLIKTLAWRTSKNQSGLTPQFDEYLFGDITDPQTGSILSVSLKSSGTGPSFAGFNISNDNMNLDGRRPIPNGLITEDILKQRVILNDTDYLDVWSYQDIVDFLVSDELVPISVIQAGTRLGTVVDNKSSVNHEDDTHANDVSHNTSSELETNIKLSTDNSDNGVSYASDNESKEDIFIDKNAEIEEYKKIAEKVISGDPTTDDIAKFMKLQSKYGPVSNL